VLSSPRFFVAACLLLALGTGLSFWRKHQVNAAPVKSVEAYWTETNLNENALEELLQDSLCSSSERHFLSCTNAILSVANRYNLTISENGKLVSLNSKSTQDMSSEKKQLEPWRIFFYEHKAQAAKISFISLWESLKADFISQQQMAMMIGTGMNGFISVFRDPHTYFLPVAMFKEVVSKADNRSTSLGILLGRKQGDYVVRKVIDGSPAAENGIKKGDVILAINGQKIAGLLQSRVNELLKGEVGAVTRLRIAQNGEVKKMKLKRTEITVATISTKILKGAQPVAVVTINKFAKNACEKTREALVEANAAGARGLLLDLRDNPGGQMEEAACVVSLFVGPNKRVFEIRYLEQNKESERYISGEDQVFDKPVAVLINASSASAAEIVAGALRDFNRAVLVGEKSFGKGSFQEGELWAANKKLALFETKGFYYLPSGRSPQMRGLEPDVKVSFDESLVAREADQFIHPLEAPGRKLNYVKSAYSAQGCLSDQDGVALEDQQLLKAREVLFCAQPVAGVQQ
jgi:carboxyl-terminal processing protease